MKWNYWPGAPFNERQILSQNCLAWRTRPKIATNKIKQNKFPFYKVSGQTKIRCRHVKSYQIEILLRNLQVPRKSWRPDEWGYVKQEMHGEGICKNCSSKTGGARLKLRIQFQESQRLRAVDLCLPHLLN